LQHGAGLRRQHVADAVQRTRVELAEGIGNLLGAAAGSHVGKRGKHSWHGSPDRGLRLALAGPNQRANVGKRSVRQLILDLLNKIHDASSTGERQMYETVPARQAVGWSTSGRGPTSRLGGDASQKWRTGFCLVIAPTLGPQADSPGRPCSSLRRFRPNHRDLPAVVTRLYRNSSRSAPTTATAKPAMLKVLMSQLN